MTPFVSVIIPVKNEEKSLPQLIHALSLQTYPSDRWETIIVDNGSKDRTIEIAKSAPNATVLREPKVGSYAARNLGISAARGNILAFTDGDCLPHPDWIAEGATALTPNVDIAAGNISFVIRVDDAANRFDAQFFLQQELNVHGRCSGSTANLFIKRGVFEKVGCFPSDLTSGGDFALCQKAVAAGFSLSYHPKAIVFHPSRGLVSLIKKAFRIGRGKAERLLLSRESIQAIAPRLSQNPDCSRNTYKRDILLGPLLLILVCVSAVLGMIERTIQLAISKSAGLAPFIRRIREVRT